MLGSVATSTSCHVPYAPSARSSGRGTGRTPATTLLGGSSRREPRARRRRGGRVAPSGGQVRLDPAQQAVRAVLLAAQVPGGRRRVVGRTGPRLDPLPRPHGGGVGGAGPARHR